MKHLILFLTIISLTYANSLEITIKEQYLIPNAKNNFTIKFKCTEQDYLINGETARYQVRFALENLTLNTRIEGTFPFIIGKEYYKKVSIFMPAGMKNLTIMVKTRNNLLNLWKQRKNQTFTFKKEGGELIPPQFIEERSGGFEFKMFSLFTAGAVFIIGSFIIIKFISKLFPITFIIGLLMCLIGFFFNI